MFERRVKFRPTVRVDGMVATVDAKDNLDIGFVRVGNRERRSVKQGRKHGISVRHHGCLHVVLFVVPARYVITALEQMALEHCRGRGQICHMVANRDVVLGQIIDQ